jgi:hypothetical protein
MSRSTNRSKPPFLAKLSGSQARVDTRPLTRTPPTYGIAAAAPGASMAIVRPFDR